MSNVKYDFRGLRYVVTGASSGIGRQIALELAESGALVLCVARRECELKELKSMYPDFIEYASCDVNNKEKLELAISSFVKNNGKINGCVHAAGISSITPIKMFDEDLAHDIFDTSFWAGINLIQICTKNKYCEDGTSNVVFSSSYAFNPAKGMFAYSGAKAALNAAVKSIAKEISNKRHRINAIAPGWVKTNMTDNAIEVANTSCIFDKMLLGLGDPKDISGVVLFLLSDRAKWITGTNMIVDGGFLAN